MLDEVWDYISISEKIKSHSFFPLIHYKKETIKYDGKAKIYKERDIYYSSHRDRFVLQYYSFKLNVLYNEWVKQNNLEKTAIAYRTDLKMNNIHFSKIAFDFIKKAKPCDIIIGDFTNFFDNLDHQYMKDRLSELLEGPLPADYYTVFKNITRYSYWEMEDILELNKLEHSEKGILELNKLYKVMSHSCYKKNKKKYIRKNTNSFGVPQGSAISSVLSNIYMMAADKEINQIVTKFDGLYMRYSDDFIIVLPQHFKAKFEDAIKIIQSIPRLTLEEKKTQSFFYNGIDIINRKSNKKDHIQYLGFCFDGQSITIREKTIAKYYYRLYRKIKTIVNQKGISKTGKKIGFRNLYEKYSIKGKRNFLSYTRNAEKTFTENEKIGNIRKRHMRKIGNRLNKIKNL